MNKGACLVHCIVLKVVNSLYRLKDGNGEAFYPRSSFTIDCTGMSFWVHTIFIFIFLDSSLCFVSLSWLSSAQVMCALEMLSYSNRKYIRSTKPYLVYNFYMVRFNLVTFLIDHFSWNSSDKITRSRSWRTVAGRIVKESYGAARQQHTFTVRPILNGRWELEEFYAKEVRHEGGK